MTTTHLDTDRHSITDAGYVAVCRERLDHDGALVLHGFAALATFSGRTS
jgi:hypothetical protein